MSRYRLVKFAINYYSTWAKSRFPALQSERGYTLLEYTAGAAIVLGIIWTALEAMGQNVGDLLDAIGKWAVDRKDCINNPDTAGCAHTPTEG